MKRNRLENDWYAVRPMLLYLILFVAFRTVLYELINTAVVSSSYDLTSGYPVWYTVSETVVIGIASAGAALFVAR